MRLCGKFRLACALQMRSCVMLAFIAIFMWLSMKTINAISYLRSINQSFLNIVTFCPHDMISARQNVEVIKHLKEIFHEISSFSLSTANSIIAR